MAPPHSRIPFWITLGGVIAVTVYLILRIAGPYVEALLTGAGLASLFYPLHQRLSGHLRRTNVAAWISTFLVVLLILVPLSWATARFVAELSEAYQSLGPDAVDTGTAQVWRWVDGLAERVGAEPDAVRELLRSRLQQLGNAVLQNTISVAGAATGGILKGLVVIGAFHFSLLHGAWLRDQTLDHSPLGVERTQALLDAIREMIRASFYGVMAVAAGQGTLLGIGAWIAGLPIPSLWGLAAAAVSVLPVLGSALVWIPGTLFLLAQGKTGMAIFFLVWGAGLVANTDNLIRPLVVMASLPVSGLLVFVAILGGIQAFGLLGVFAGPVTLAVSLALLRMLRAELAPVITQEPPK